MSRLTIESIRKKLSDAKSQHDKFRVLQNASPDAFYAYYNFSNPEEKFEDKDFLYVYELVKLAAEYGVNDYLIGRTWSVSEKTGNNLMHHACSQGDAAFVELVLKSLKNAGKKEHFEWYLSLFERENNGVKADQASKDDKGAGAKQGDDKKAELKEPKRRPIELASAEDAAKIADVVVSMMLASVAEDYRSLVEENKNNNVTEVLNPYIISLETLERESKARGDAPWHKKIALFAELANQINEIYYLGSFREVAHMASGLLKVSTKLYSICDPSALELKRLLQKTPWEVEAIKKHIESPEYVGSNMQNLLALINSWSHCDKTPAEDKFLLFQMMVSKCGNLDQFPSNETETLLELLIRRERFDLAKILLAHGASTQPYGFDRQTLLHKFADKPKCLRFVLENCRGIDINAKDFRATTALHNATENLESVLLLIRFGANKNIKNLNGHVAALYASHKVMTDKAFLLAERAEKAKSGGNLLHALFTSDEIDGAIRGAVLKTSLNLADEVEAKNKHGKRPIDLIVDDPFRLKTAKEMYDVLFANNVKKPLEDLKTDYQIAGKKDSAEMAGEILKHFDEKFEELKGKKWETMSAKDFKDLQQKMLDEVNAKLNDPKVQAWDGFKVLNTILGVLTVMLVVTNVMWAFADHRDRMFKSRAQYELTKQSRTLTTFDKAVSPSLLDPEDKKKAEESEDNDAKAGAKVGAHGS